MQRFTLVHDGSRQGWQAAYLSFYVAAQLGAPLQALMMPADSDENSRANRAAQVEVGAHAAGVAIETLFISEFSIESILAASGSSNGFFVPRHLVPEEKIARGFLDALSCPLWLVSNEPETNGVAILINDLVAEEALINYAAALSHRLTQTLTGLVMKSDLRRIPLSGMDFSWLAIPDFSLSTISTALDRMNANLLILSIAQFSLSSELPFNCVFYPINIDT